VISLRQVSFVLFRLLYQVRLAQSGAWYAVDHSLNSWSPSSFVMEHPLNAFFLIQRFGTAWQLIDELVFNTDALQGLHWLFVTLTVALKCLASFSSVRISVSRVTMTPLSCGMSFDDAVKV